MTTATTSFLTFSPVDYPEISVLLQSLSLFDKLTVHEELRQRNVLVVRGGGGEIRYKFIFLLREWNMDQLTCLVAKELLWLWRVLLV